MKLSLPVVFRAPWWLAVLATGGVVFCVILQVLCWWMILVDPFGLPLALLVGFGAVSLLLLVPIYAALDAMYGYTAIDRDGVTLVRLFRRKRFIPLADVVRFIVNDEARDDGFRGHIQICVKGSWSPVQFAGHDLRTWGWRSGWLAETNEQLNAWLDIQQLRYGTTTA